MKILGITRRIDELGRIVIPKEIRKNLRLKTGDLMEFGIEEDVVILKKHSVLDKNKQVLEDFIKILSLKIKAKIVITNLTEIVLSSDNENINEKIIEDIKKIALDANDVNSFSLTDAYNVSKPYKIYPINPNGDLIGFLLFDLKTNENKSLMDFANYFINSYIENF